ncbi:MAG TPA: efflux RND transporter periplasmic adaptor subunit [Candidatus Saccharimonadales bacterium]|jgi:Cu(I)/Ag(I) efflux system membrane fusion protein|nr:efflux RND transporter periplasmic adaptor subunit [Candidatus Saccharimonadales bacterium]
MRRNILAFFVLALIAAGSYGLIRHYPHFQTESNAQRRIIYYVDPMHPAYKSDKPGIAPDCGMKLVPVYQDDNTSAPTNTAEIPAGEVKIDANTQRLLGIRVTAANKGGTAHTVRVVGRVSPEDNRIYSINSGVDGFIRETYNDSVGMLVKKNQKIAAYYAPDFVAAASGFLAATERIPGSVGKDGARFTPNFPGTVAKEGVRSIQGYTDHLRNLGMSDDQIKRMADSRELPESIDIVSPTDGFILSRNVSPGQHFDHMMEFYKIADLSHVWVIAEVYEDEAQYLRPGSTAQIILHDEGRRMTALVADSLPQSEAGGGTAKIRLEVDNPTFMLRPDMLVDVETSVRIPTTVTVPMDAVVDSGQHARVYVEHGDETFELREVEIGRRVGDQIEILHGVQSGERVVSAATFFVDSESRMKMPASAPSMTPDIHNKPSDKHEHMASMQTMRDPM